MCGIDSQLLSLHFNCPFDWANCAQQNVNQSHVTPSQSFDGHFNGKYHDTGAHSDQVHLEHTSQFVPAHRRAAGGGRQGDGRIQRARKVEDTPNVDLLETVLDKAALQHVEVFFDWRLCGHFVRNQTAICAYQL